MAPCSQALSLHLDSQLPVVKRCSSVPEPAESIQAYESPDFGELLATGGTDLLDTNCTTLDTELLESGASAFEADKLTAVERWRRGFRLVQTQAALALQRSKALMLLFCCTACKPLR